MTGKTKPESQSEKIRVLGGILNSVGNFDMSTFDGRLIFQKTIYFLQAFRIYLGYNFSLFIHGPYSPNLTRDGFELKDKITSIPKIEFTDSETKKNFEMFSSFIENFKDKPDQLETLASLHLFKKLFPNDDKDSIIDRVLYHKPYLQKNTCEESWNALEKFGLV